MIWNDSVSTYYSPRSHQRRALRAIFFMVFLAAVPATLGGLSQVLPAMAPASQHAAATAAQLGNQLQGPTLGKSGVAVPGAQGRVLAFCSGANTVTRSNCPPSLSQFNVE